jgi:hypothetical protein
MRILQGIADTRNPLSPASKARLRRFEFFIQLLQRVPRPTKILDVGGTQDFWEKMNFADEPSIRITLLNLATPYVTRVNFRGIEGDATKMSCFSPGEFDVVFSNSVIEHVGGREEQARMAREIQRVGKRYFVQTPNFYFPIEPHFLFPGFQWLPSSVRILLIKYFDLGWFKKTLDKKKARAIVDSVHLLRKKELLLLFPDSNLYKEKIFGLIKSFVVYKGW